jgi:hypothetical protein
LTLKDKLYCKISISGNDIISILIDMIWLD